MQYGEECALQLLAKAKVMTDLPPGKVIFRQGDMINDFFVIVRGTVKIEQTKQKYIHKKDMLPIVIRTCYDGD